MRGVVVSWGLCLLIDDFEVTNWPDQDHSPYCQYYVNSKRRRRDEYEELLTVPHLTHTHSHTQPTFSTIKYYILLITSTQYHLLIASCHFMGTHCIIFQCIFSEWWPVKLHFSGAAVGPCCTLPFLLVLGEVRITRASMGLSGSSGSWQQRDSFVLPCCHLVSQVCRVQIAIQGLRTNDLRNK